ncbi:MAG: hypothetical protein ACRDP9_27865 [Kribbellaceae bacterium]
MALPGVSVADRDAIVADHNEGLQTQAWVNYLVIVAAAAVLTLGATTIPAALSLRSRPAEAATAVD